MRDDRYSAVQRLPTGCQERIVPHLYGARATIINNNIHESLPKARKGHSGYKRVHGRLGAAARKFSTFSKRLLHLKVSLDTERCSSAAS